MFRLDGKVGAVTGGAKGIGRGMARVFARAGARVAVLDLEEAAGRTVVEAIREEGGEALVVDGGQTLPESSLALEGLYEDPTR